MGQLIELSNDTQEFSYGIELFHSEATKLYESRFISPKTKELVRDAIRTVDKIDITHCFSISACLERDSTKLWSSYADVIDPVSIGFSAYAALTPRQHPATHKANDFFKGEWRKVIYDINQQRIFISEIFGLIDEMHNREENPVIYRKKLHTVSQTILCAIAFLKSPDFSHEEEVRCVFLNEKMEFSTEMALTEILHILRSYHHMLLTIILNMNDITNHFYL